MLLALLKTMRPKQWPKNGFLYAGMIFDGQLTNPIALARTTAGFLIFCLLSSVVYIINDLVDIEADRQHPTKRFRPIPSGELPLPAARIAVVVLLLIAFPLAYWLSPVFAGVALAYVAINLAYSFWLKHIPILDVMVLASLYVLRVAAGVELVVVGSFSPWLYVFTTFLALFLGIGKRRAELNLSNNSGAARRVLEGYTLPLLDQLLSIASNLTIITYSFYTFTAQNLPKNHTMMLTIPFVIYGIFRYLYLIQVEHSGAAPEEVLFTDRPLQASLICFGVAILIIFYYLPRTSI
jgi:4-hydroxybenzoate polyprenyltransferase